MKFLRRIPARIALAVFSRALRRDPELAAKWHASIVHVLTGAWQIKSNPHEVARRVMKRLFGVDIPAEKQPWRDTPNQKVTF
jgi:ABC-type hemin transport system ATPase subunit